MYVNAFGCSGRRMFVDGYYNKFNYTRRVNLFLVFCCFILDSEQVRACDLYCKMWYFPIKLQHGSVAKCCGGVR